VITAPTLTRKSIDLWASGLRAPCWREECRSANRDYNTVTYEHDRVIARCHRGEYRSLLDLRVELSAHAG
jgi:hypothetical protein